MANRRPPIWWMRWRLPIVVSAGYLVFGVLWIAISDAVVLRAAGDETTVTAIQNYKGWAYVTASAVFLFGMLAVAVRRLFRTEEALERTSIQYRHLIDAMSDGVWIRDIEGTTVFINDSLAKLIGTTPDELRQHGPQRYIRDASGEPLEEEDTVAQHIQSKRVVQIVSDNNTTRWGLLSMNAIRDRAGELLGDLLIVTDMTDRVDNERALREANESQRRLLDELHHRVRNNLTSLHSLIDMTRIAEVNPDTTMSRLHGRISAMTTAHELLSETEWKPVQIMRLLRRIIEGPYEQCVQLNGPDIGIRPECVTPLAGTIAELFSHARLQGAIRSFSGTVSVSWSQPENDQPELVIRWVESRESEAVDPTFEEAESMIRGLVRTDLRGRVTSESTPTHHVVTIGLPSSVIAQARSHAGG